MMSSGKPTLLVCARCDVTPPCPCGGEARAESRLPSWFGPGAFYLPPELSVYDGVDPTPPTLEDVEAIFGHSLGEGDGDPWIALVRLRDGRWCYLCYTVQITGDVWWEVSLAATRERLWWAACTDEDRARFTRQLTRGALEAELVEIDALLESADPAERALGERRMRQRNFV